jgi:hypothetical protein
MSYYAYDANGYIGDVASAGGYGHFMAWASQQGGPIRQFADKGEHNDPAALATALERAARPRGPDAASADSVRLNMAALARLAEEVFIVNNGVEPDNGEPEDVFYGPGQPAWKRRA